MNPRPALHFMRRADRGDSGSAADFYGVLYHGTASTHLDALCHLWGPDGIYGGRSPDEVIGIERATFGDVDQYRDGIITRGVLLDVPAYRGEEFVTQDRPVQGDELAAICEQGGFSVEPGDAIVVYSGREAWGRHAGRPWGSGETTSPPAERIGPDRPGLHASCLQFIRDTDCAVLVWDMMDAFPNGVGVRWSVHAAIYAFGLALVDNALLEPLAQECRASGRHDFMLVVSPLRVVGGTGSPANPLAVLSFTGFQPEVATMALTEIQDVTETAIATDRIPVIDVDVHPSVPITSDIIKGRLSVRDRDYLDLVGLRNVSTERTIPPQRKFTHRLDAVDPSGRTGVVPEFTRGQLLDEFDMSGAVLGDAGALALSHGNSNFPVFVGEELCGLKRRPRRALDRHRRPLLPLINVLVEQPEWAAAEIHRVRQTPAGDRYPGILLEPRSENPIGNPKYWPIFEACEDEGIAVAFHVSPGRRMTPSGNISYYYEWHCQFTLRAYTVVSSMIFEGVFDRFPGLKVALIEVGMYWAVPFSWRLDHSWKLHREEVPHLQRKSLGLLRGALLLLDPAHRGARRPQGLLAGGGVSREHLRPR